MNQGASRRTPLARVAPVIIAIAVAFALASAPLGQARPAGADEPPLATYVSTSGITHSDIGDLSIRAGRGWHPGDPAGINDSWRQAIQTVIGRIAAEHPDAVMLQGDVVEGRWGQDVQRTGIFGPVRTFDEQKRAIVAAGNLYYGENKRWWAAQGLHPFYAIGDHEIGDIGFAGYTSPGTLRYQANRTWMDVWARSFTASGTKYASRPRGTLQEATAYAVRIAPDTLIMTVDPFVKWRTGIRPRVSSSELAWMDTRMAAARANGVQHIIVRSEVPALGPNRSSHSSNVMLENGAAFWDVLERQHVDLLLSGEFHAMTTYAPGGHTPVQVVHGGAMGLATASYLVIQVYSDHIQLTLKEICGSIVSDAHSIWATAWVRPPYLIDMRAPPVVVGTATITHDGKLIDRTGYLTEGIG